MITEYTVALLMKHNGFFDTLGLTAPIVGGTIHTYRVFPPTGYCIYPVRLVVYTAENMTAEVLSDALYPLISFQIPDFPIDIDLFNLQRQNYFTIRITNNGSTTESVTIIVSVIAIPKDEATAFERDFMKIAKRGG